MKKVFAVGVATMLMMGAASQAMAAFDYGSLIMTVYDRDALMEKSFDLGNIDTLLSTTGTQTFTIDVANMSSWTFAANKSGVGMFANQFDFDAQTSKGYYALSTENPTKAQFSGDPSGFDTASNNLMTIMRSDADDTIATGNVNSYTYGFNNKGNSPASYAALVTKTGFEAEYPTVDGTVATMYLYGFDTDADYNTFAINGGEYIATITLSDAGVVTFTANPVPVPGAALLFGSALLGLAGIRRRQNS